MAQPCEELGLNDLKGLLNQISGSTGPQQRAIMGSAANRGTERRAGCRHQEAHQQTSQCIPHCLG